MFAPGHSLQDLSGPAADLIQVPAASFTAFLATHKYQNICSFEILEIHIKTRNKILIIKYVPQTFISKIVFYSSYTSGIQVCKNLPPLNLILKGHLT